MAYFGVIESILELDYSGLRFPVFKCQWVNNSGGRRIDEFGFVSVDLSKTGYKDDPYILPSLVTQVFYIADPSKKNWSIVMQSNRNHVDPVDDESTEIYMNYLIENESSFFTSILQEFDAPENGLNDEPFYLRRDHREGIFINTEKAKASSCYSLSAEKKNTSHKKMIIHVCNFLFYFHFIIVFILLNIFWFFFLTG